MDSLHKPRFLTAFTVAKVSAGLVGRGFTRSATVPQFKEDQVIRAREYTRKAHHCIVDSCLSRTTVTARGGRLGTALLPTHSMTSRHDSHAMAVRKATTCPLHIATSKLAEQYEGYRPKMFVSYRDKAAEASSSKVGKQHNTITNHHKPVYSIHQELPTIHATVSGSAAQ